MNENELINYKYLTDEEKDEIFNIAKSNLLRLQYQIEEIERKKISSNIFLQTFKQGETK